MPKRSDEEAEGWRGKFRLANVGVDVRRRVSIPDAIRTRIDWLKAETPQDMLFRLLEDGRVACIPLGSPLSGTVVEMLNGDDEEQSAAAAQSYFFSRSEGERIKLPEAVIGHLLALETTVDAEGSQLIWLFARPRSLELWNDQFRLRRLARARGTIDSRLQELGQETSD